MEKTFARTAQARSARSSLESRDSSAERGPPTHPVSSAVGWGCVVHQTEGISPKLNRKLRSSIGDEESVFQKGSRKRSVNRRACPIRIWDAATNTLSGRCVMV